MFNDLPLAICNIDIFGGEMRALSGSSFSKVFISLPKVSGTTASAKRNVARDDSVVVGISSNGFDTIKGDCSLDV